MNNVTLAFPSRLETWGEILKDFNRSFLPFMRAFDFDDGKPTFVGTRFDQTGFPRANLKNVSTKTEDLLEFTLALPGWNKQNSKLDIKIVDGTLTIDGSLKETDSTDHDNGENYGKEYYRNISLKNSFEWKYNLMTEDAEFKTASLKDGLLKIVVKLPRPTENIKTIEVK